MTSNESDGRRKVENKTNQRHKKRIFEAKEDGIEESVNQPPV
jgi:hypothetical protein